LEKDINKDIGLKLDILSLSPVLKIGITVEYFNLDGKDPAGVCVCVCVYVCMCIYIYIYKLLIVILKSGNANVLDDLTIPEVAAVKSVKFVFLQ
jgi:hypothetical protein